MRRGLAASDASHAGNASSNLAGVTLKKTRDSDSDRSPLVRCGKYVSRGCTWTSYLFRFATLSAFLINRAWLEVPVGKHQVRRASELRADECFVAWLETANGGSLCRADFFSDSSLRTVESLDPGIRPLADPSSRRPLAYPCRVRPLRAERPCLKRGQSLRSFLCTSFRSASTSVAMSLTPRSVSTANMVSILSAPPAPQPRDLEVSWDVSPFDETTQDEGVVLSFDDQHPAMTSGEENFARVKPKNMGIVDVRDKASEALLLVGVQSSNLDSVAIHVAARQLGSVDEPGRNP